MPRIPKSIRSTRQILNGSNHILQSLLTQSRELTSIRKIVGHYVRDECAVASLKNSNLTLISPTGSIASKIRYRQRNIIAALRRSGLEVSRLNIKVQPEEFRRAAPLVERRLTPENARQLVELADSIKHDSLKKALMKLARHTD